MSQQHEITSKFIRLGKRIPAVIYESVDKTQNSSIAVLVMHSDEDYLTCPTGEEMAKRGFVAMCANVINKEGIVFSQNEKMHCVRAAVEYLKEYPGVKKVILMGHSGGATLMTAYQAIAENGSDLFAGEEMIYPYKAKRELIPADGLMLFDANWGNSVMQLLSLDPAVVDENSGMKLNPEYNLFEEANGFDPEGSAFSDEFIAKFQKEQGNRNNRILNYALERNRLIDEGKGQYIDDEPFCIPGAAQSFFNNKLYAQDTRLMSHTEDEHDLIHADGSITHEIIRSIRTPENNESFTNQMWEGARLFSIKTYLSSYAIRTLENYGFDETHVWGIDWATSYTSPLGNVMHIKVPTLVVGMTAGWEFLASESIYRMSASEDKQIAFIEGATHKFHPAKHLEKYPGEFGDTVALLHDYAAEWLEEGRFA